MLGRLFNLVAAVSLLLAATVAVLWVISYPGLRPDFVDLSWQVGPGSVKSESGWVLFRVGRGMVPRRGSPELTEWRVPGLVYRRVTGAQPSVLVGVPHALVLVAFAALPAVALRRRLRERRRRQRALLGLCPSCGYDLRATAGQCPECGPAADEPAASREGGGAASRPPRRLLDALPRRARVLVRAAVWGSAAAACVCVAVPLLVIVTGWTLDWRHAAGNTKYSWGAGGSGYYIRRVERFPHGPSVPGEAAVASGGRLVKDGSFWLGGWSHAYRDVYYSAEPPPTSGPNDHFDPQILLRYRPVLDEDHRQFSLDAWRCAAVLSLLPALVLLNVARRYVVHGRPSDAARCRACGCDPRATPGRCPACATPRPEGEPPPV